MGQQRLGANSRRCHAGGASGSRRDRKSTRLNSSHGYISYAVFCLKKKKTATYSGRTHSSCIPNPWQSPCVLLPQTHPANTTLIFYHHDLVHVQIGFEAST